MITPLKKIYTGDFGDTVICDFCNDDFTNSLRGGGALIGSWAICPSCADKPENRSVSRRNPVGVPFKDFVLKLRNGNNKIIIYG